MKKALLTLAAFALVVAACGGSSDGEAAETTAAPATTSAPTTTTAAPTTTTAAPTTTTEAESFIPSGDPEIDAVATAYMVAFDSTTDFDTKVPHVEDLTGLEQTVLDYMAQGDSMGGVTIVMKSVVINGETADVLYDLMFNNRPIYPDLPGTALLIDGGWKVPRTEFCGMMSSARVPCPTE